MIEFLKGLKSYLFFYAGYLVFFFAGTVLLITAGKAGSFLKLNEYHRPWLNQFFIWYTNLGDGFFAILLSLLFFFLMKKRKLGLVLLIAYAFTGIIAQIIKPIIESPRPETYFKPDRPAFFIDDIIHQGNTSFPSGHTVTAFAVAAVLVLYANAWWQQTLLLLYAVLVGFSRIYLSQHFLLDVLAGSLIGIAGALLCEYWCRNLRDEQLVFLKGKG